MKNLISLCVATLLYTGLNAQTISDGTRAFENDQLNSAKKIFQSLLGSKPEDATIAYYQLASIYMTQNTADSAELVINRMQSAYPSHVMSKVATGKLNLYKKNTAAAKLNFDDALKMTASKDAKVMGWIADAYLSTENKDAAAALQVLTVATKLEPKNADLYLLIGDAHKLDLNSGGPAITNYEKVIELNTLLTKANQRIGLIYSQARNYQNSSEYFEKSLALDANYAPALHDYAMLNYNFKQYEKSRNLYEKYLSVADTTEQSLTRYVYILFMCKDYPAATTMINSLMARDANNNLLNRLLAYSYAEQKQDSIGLTYMQKFLAKVEPSKIIPLDYRYNGRMLSRTGSDSLGIEQLKLAIQYDSTDVDMWQDMGEALNRLKKYCEAAAAFKQKINISKNPSALDYFYLTKAYYYCKDYVNADSAALVIVNLKASSHIGWLWRGNANSKMYPDDLEKSLPYYQKVAEISDSAGTKIPNNDAITAYRFLAVYNIKKENNIAGKEFYNKILARDPKDADAIETLKKIK